MQYSNTMKNNLKYYPQQRDYACGPACLRMVFEHLGKKCSEEKLLKLCQTSEKYGTSHKHLINAIRNEKFKYYSKNKANLQDLIKHVNSRYLTIINYVEPSSNEGHYAVVTGYTDDKKKIILADPYNGNNFTILWRELKGRWHNTNNTSHGWFVAVRREKINI